MSLYQFNSEWYRVITGWDALGHQYYLDIYERHVGDTDPIFTSMSLPHPAMTLEQIADTLTSYGIAAPQTLLQDLRMDAAQNRGDFDVHYDPETGTASIQAEYGDRADNDALDAAQDRSQAFVQRAPDFLDTDDIVRITFESGRQVVVPATEFRDVIDEEERVAAFDTFTPKEWEDAGNLPLPGGVETSRIRELVDRLREWFHRGHDQGMGL